MDSRGVGTLFKKINAGLATIANDTTTLISEGTKLSGDISFSGTIEILGTVEGNILSEQKDAKVRILNGGVVKGDIKSSIIEVNGVVEGSIYAVDHLALAHSLLALVFVSRQHRQKRLHLRRLKMPQKSKIFVAIISKPSINNGSSYCSRNIELGFTVCQ
jgi:hypothetical protein